MTELEQFMIKVLSLGGMFPSHGDGLFDSIMWRTDPPNYTPIKFFVNCNDLFYWACADLEDLTPENLPELLKAIEDCRKAYGLPANPPLDFEVNLLKTKEGSVMWHNLYDCSAHGAMLFCARMRKMRPQKPVLKNIPKELLPLFEACGPERNE